MSQQILTDNERVKAIRSFGYTEREAQFLCLAALHGGYFLRRQYCYFLGKETGGTAAAMIEKALAKGHAKTSVYSHNTHIYHLCTRPFYAALGQVDNRNRRDRQPRAIRTKLMSLDFVLSHPQQRYLATEQEKLDYFTEVRRIEQWRLPVTLYRSPSTVRTTARYFVDKWPIFVSPEPAEQASSPVSFCFVDEGLVGVSGFETYLTQYSRLFAALGGFRVIYVASQTALLPAAEGVFERFLKTLAEESHAYLDPQIKRMLNHFVSRRAYENQQFSSFDRAALIRLRDDSVEFSGPQNEALFERWKSGGDRAVLDVIAPDAEVPQPVVGTFSKCILEHSYDFFGSLRA